MFKVIGTALALGAVFFTVFSVPALGVILASSAFLWVVFAQPRPPRDVADGATPGDIVASAVERPVLVRVSQR